MYIYHQNSHLALMSPTVYINEPVCIPMGNRNFTSRQPPISPREHQPRGGMGGKHPSTCRVSTSHHRDLSPEFLLCCGFGGERAVGVESLGGGERKQERKSVESHAKQEQGEVQPEPPAQPDAGEQKTAPGLWISGAGPETGDWRLHSWVTTMP